MFLLTISFELFIYICFIFMPNDKIVKNLLFWTFFSKFLNESNKSFFISLRKFYYNDPGPDFKLKKKFVEVFGEKNLWLYQEYRRNLWHLFYLYAWYNKIKKTSFPEILVYAQSFKTVADLDLAFDTVFTLLVFSIRIWKFFFLFLIINYEFRSKSNNFIKKDKEFALFLFWIDSIYIISELYEIFISLIELFAFKDAKAFFDRVAQAQLVYDEKFKSNFFAISLDFKLFAEGKSKQESCSILVNDYIIKNSYLKNFINHLFMNYLLENNNHVKDYFNNNTSCLSVDEALNGKILFFFHYYFCSSEKAALISDNAMSFIITNSSFLLQMSDLECSFNSHLTSARAARKKT